ncbi:substrate-binding domain-containing protein [Actibacterium lipolyticum]|uniref:substrate-binding domain-containing protein n=1 Tax=Actibacterium lipolyticum TaxID=1524263 RepID=UPI000BB453B8|nr:substrate-binding domain-containing protein [Actibacterium lipolyticum]
MNLKQLSQTLGLSQTTVSRALNGYPEVSEATRRRVHAAAIAHNYRPNTRAKGLATGRAMAIGHVIPIATKHEMVNPVFADFIAGAGEAYSNAGYDMHLSVVKDADEERIYCDLASKRNVDGVIVHAPLINDPRIKLLREIGLPFVVHGRSSGEEGPYSWLDINNRRAFSRATGFLLDLGHRRIGLINGLEHMDFAQRRRDGYTSALDKRGIAADPALMVSEEMTETNGYRSALNMLEQDTPPTAFLVSSIISAIGVRRAIEELGLKMGKDVSLIVHDDELSYFKNSDGMDVPLFTATRSSVRDAGRQAAEMLLSIIQSPDTAPQSRLLEAELTLGRSTCPAPQEAK